MTTEKKWTGNEVRSTFLRFFEERGHRVVRSSSLVPANDPTLLFTNAGMNQFKDVFLGLDKRDYNRATSCQKCVRAGGKHNDLENVGFTNRHHTFFEMLGNFSFGDYFKKEAIAYAWELITSPEWYGIPKNKLYATVFKGEEGIARDSEAYDLWLATGVAKDRIFEMGMKDNFWAMGDTGPCGPCSEIHYDMGPAASEDSHTDCAFPCECGRYVEIWNLVFMQFNRDASGVRNPLPKPSVDTGMGLERITCALLNVSDPSKVSNYDTDLFTPLIKKAETIIPPETRAEGPLNQNSLRIIADHSRATTFLVSDGVMPSNEGRGYVLRKIARRALRHADMLRNGKPPAVPILPEMSDSVRGQMSAAYPELQQNAARIDAVLAGEEAQFSRTVENGLKHLELDLTDSMFLKDGLAIQHPVYDGAKAFRLYDTFGLPKDFIEDAARDAGVEVDWAGFDRAMEEQRTRARASWKGAHKESASPVYAKLRETHRTEPDFYFGTKSRDARVEAIVTKQGATNELKAGQEAEIVLDRTSIYSESGGQVADTGAFFDNSGALQVAEVRGAYYPVSGLVAHRVVAKEDIHVGDRVSTVADPVRRAQDMRNHSSTHLLHAALRNTLGTHVKQAGSLVAPNHLRFDFSHFAAVDPSELAEIEQQVNEEIWKNAAIETDIMNIEDALASGAIAFFGDKYPEHNVRVVTIPDADRPRGFYSKELCGGTHVTRLGEIGLFKITGEGSVAAGVRRIEAISGDRALSEYQNSLATIRNAAAHLNVADDALLSAIERQAESIKQLEKQLETVKRKAAGSAAGELVEQAKTVRGVRLIAAKVDGFDRDALRQMVDTLRQKLGSGVVVLATAEDGKVSLIAAVTKDLNPKLHAGKIVQELAKLVGGSGGGRPDLAEAGGKDTSGIQNAIDQVYPLIDRLL
jgi:alanyl-tRNA synthetase